MTLGAFLVSIAIAAVGFRAGAPASDQPADAFTGVRIIYAVLPFALWVGAMLTLRPYDLTEARFNAIKADLQRRAQAPAHAATADAPPPSQSAKVASSAIPP